MSADANEQILPSADLTAIQRQGRLAKRLNAIAYYGFLAVTAAILVLILSVIKAKTIYANQENRWLIGYSIFVTSFILMRVLAATLYRNSISKIMDHADFISQQAKEYEPMVSFVIPCKNEGPDIENTVRKCFEADWPAEKLEVIVINDGSTDNTGQVLSKLKRHYKKRLTVVTWRKNRGKRQGMAEGFRRSTGEIIIQLDSDSYIQPDTFRNLIKPFVHDDVAAVCAHAEPSNADKNLLTRMQTAYYFMSFRILKAAESVFMAVFCCSGCSSAYRKNAVMPVMDEWLNEQFLGKPATWGDDRALTNYIIRGGFKAIYTDLARAYTICPDNWRQFIKQQTRWKKSWITNAYFCGRFIWRKKPFLAFTYFFPLILVSLLTPLVAMRAMIINPIFRDVLPFYYLFGAMLLAAIITVFYRIADRTNKYWPYLFAWAGLNCIFLSFILFYAMLTIQNRKWGTR